MKKVLSGDEIDSILNVPRLNVDDSFGYWFSGLVDGEGHFILDCRNQVSTYEAVVRKVGLKVQLRGDDLRVLQRVRENIGGTVSNNGSWYYLWLMSDASSCANLLVPLFDRYPLFSKKKEEYEIWRTLVLEHYDLQRNRRELGRVKTIKVTNELNTKFVEGMAKIKIIRDFQSYLEGQNGKNTR